MDKATRHYLLDDQVRYLACYRMAVARGDQPAIDRLTKILVRIEDQLRKG